MEKRKKIIFAVTNDLNFDQRMIRICNTLQHSGFECCLVGRTKSASLPLISKGYKQVRLNCFFEKGKLFYLEYNIRLFFFLLFQKCWTYCSIDADTILAMYVASVCKKVNLVFDAHEIFTEVPEVKDRKLIRKIWQIAEKLAFRKADLKYTVGNKLAEYFSSTYNTEVHVVRNVPLAINTAQYKPDADKFILYQGALNKGRGLEAAIEAMQFLPCKLVIAGEGDLSQELRELVVKCKLESKVEFLGFVLPENLPALTSRAWLGLNVSENAGLSYFLSMNNKCFDYIRAGLPSLMNPFPEYIALNNQFNIGLTATADAQSIAQQASILLNDEKLHRQISNNCIEAAKDLNWEIESEKLIKLYHSIQHGQ